MNHHLIYIMLLILISFSCTTNRYEEKWPNGNIREIRVYQTDGDRGEGNYFYQTYSRDGQLREEGTRVNGQNNGPLKKYYGNGSTTFLGQYREGIPTGNFIEYYPNGQKKSDINYSYIGQLDGRYQVWDSIGRTVMAGEYSLGTPIGYWIYHNNSENRREISYNLEGVILSEKIYINSEDSESYSIQEFNSERNLISQGEFVDGLKSGDWKVFYDNGALKEAGPYYSGEKHGYWRYWAQDSVMMEEGLYSDGIRDSLWRFYYDNGFPQKEISFDGDSERLLAYWENGKKVVKNGNGRVSSIDYEFGEIYTYTYRVRDYYQNGTFSRRTSKLIKKEKRED